MQQESEPLLNDLTPRHKPLFHACADVCVTRYGLCDIECTARMGQYGISTPYPCRCGLFSGDEADDTGMSAKPASDVMLRKEKSRGGWRLRGNRENKEKRREA